MKRIGPSTAFHYVVTASKSVLTNGEVYDVARVQIKKVDQYGTKMPYAFDPFTLKAEGPIDVLGPRLISLEGGSISIYVRSLSTINPTKATLILEGEEESLKVEFLVK